MSNASAITAVAAAATRFNAGPLLLKPRLTRLTASVADLPVIRNLNSQRLYKVGQASRESRESMHGPSSSEGIRM